MLADFKVGHRVRLREHAVPGESSVPELEPDPARAPTDDEERDVVEFLVAVCADSSGRCRLLSWSVQRATVLVPALEFDGPMAAGAARSAAVAADRHLLMSLQRLRSSAQTAQRRRSELARCEASALAELGGTLRSVSLELAAAPSQSLPGAEAAAQSRLGRRGDGRRRRAECAPGACARYRARCAAGPSRPACAAGASGLASRRRDRDSAGSLRRSDRVARHHAWARGAVRGSAACALPTRGNGKRCRCSCRVRCRSCGRARCRRR